MQYIFSPDMKVPYLEKTLDCIGRDRDGGGLSENGKPVITQEQIDELKANAQDINYDVAKSAKNWCAMMS